MITNRNGYGKPNFGFFLVGRQKIALSSTFQGKLNLSGPGLSGLDISANLCIICSLGYYNRVSRESWPLHLSINTEPQLQAPRREHGPDTHSSRNRFSENQFSRVVFVNAVGAYK